MIDYDALNTQAQQIVKEISEFLPPGWTYTYKMNPGQWTVYIVRFRGDAGDRTIACNYAFDLMEAELNKGFSSMKEMLLIRQCVALSDAIEFLTKRHHYADAES
jgi:hypothetical protein